MESMCDSNQRRNPTKQNISPSQCSPCKIKSRKKWPALSYLASSRIQYIHSLANPDQHSGPPTPPRIPAKPARGTSHQGCAMTSGTSDAAAQTVNTYCPHCMCFMAHFVARVWEVCLYHHMLICSRLHPHSVHRTPLNELWIQDNSLLASLGLKEILRQEDLLTHN